MQTWMSLCFGYQPIKFLYFPKHNRVGNYVYLSVYYTIRRLLNTPKTKRSCYPNVQLRIDNMKWYEFCWILQKRKVHVLLMCKYVYVYIIWNDMKVAVYPENETQCSLNLQLRVYSMKRYEGCWINRKWNLHAILMYNCVYITWNDTNVAEYTENDTNFVEYPKTKRSCSLTVMMFI